MDSDSSGMSASSEGPMGGSRAETPMTDFFMVTEAAKGTSSETGDLAEDADLVEEGLSATARNLGKKDKN